MTTTFDLKLNELVETALLGEDQKVKTEDKINDETTVIKMDESAKSQHFFQDNNAIKVK